MIGIERAVAHGYLRARVRDYWRKRERQHEARRPRPVAQTGKPNLSGWERLAAIARDSGRLQAGGERLVA